MRVGCDIIFNMCLFQAVLQTGGQLELEVRPLFLVPDTNGFIDHLGGLKRLLQCGTYIIVVPLIGKTERQKQRKEEINEWMSMRSSKGDEEGLNCGVVTCLK